MQYLDILTVSLKQTLALMVFFFTINDPQKVQKQNENTQQSIVNNK